MKTILYLSISILFTSCALQKNTSAKIQIYWVNSIKVSCIGVAPKSCLQIKKNKPLNRENG